MHTPIEQHPLQWSQAVVPLHETPTKTARQSAKATSDGFMCFLGEFERKGTCPE